MNSSLSRYTAYIAAITLALCITITTEAQVSGSADASVSVEASASGTVNTGIVPRVKAVPGQVRQELELRKDLNKDLRNKIIEERKEDTTRARADFKASSTELRTTMKAEFRGATGTPEARKEAMMRTQGERRELLASMKKDMFAARQKALTAQLNITFDNLVDVKARVADHIAKLETAGKDVARAKTLLATVDVKLAAAKKAIDAVLAYVPPAPSANASTSASAEIALTKPREMGNAAIKALKEVRDALKDVYEAIKPLIQTQARVEKHASTTVETNASITN